jgi:hypothetical protein
MYSERCGFLAYRTPSFCSESISVERVDVPLLEKEVEPTLVRKTQLFLERLTGILSQYRWSNGHLEEASKPKVIDREKTDWHPLAVVHDCWSNRPGSTDIFVLVRR